MRAPVVKAILRGAEKLLFCGNVLSANLRYSFWSKTSCGREVRSFRLFSTSVWSCSRCPAPFGLMIDIDGVICRGPTTLPGVDEAMSYLLNSKGSFKIPTVFVTNAGNLLRLDKAKALGSKLGIEICSDQLIVSHSPLRMFSAFHDKHVLVVGQGPILEIANQLGFNHVTTIQDLRNAFPGLDCVDHNRRKHAPCSFHDYFPPIEAVILFGTPTRWETSLQLVVDVLMTGGRPSCSRSLGQVPYPHMPVLACSIDLLWMAEYNMPRFAHGAFLLCLETLYKNLSGRDLKYYALLGKPSELTYHWAEYQLQAFARTLATGPVRTVYAIGDNPETDILGANLYQQYLSQRNVQKQVQKERQFYVYMAATGPLATQGMLGHPSYQPEALAEDCLSVLVETGVYSKGDLELTGPAGIKTHSNLDDMSSRSHLKTPNFVEKDLLAAVKMIFDRENYE